jgi:hypothetical protein
LRERRLRHSEPSGGPRKIRLFGYDHNVTEASDIHIDLISKNDLMILDLYAASVYLGRLSVSEPRRTNPTIEVEDCRENASGTLRPRLARPSNGPEHCVVCE